MRHVRIGHEASFADRVAVIVADRAGAANPPPAYGKIPRMATRTKKDEAELLPQQSDVDSRFRIGTGGWTYVPWRKNFYPDGLAQRRELEYASRYLTAIEINGTYYGAQKPAIYAKWQSETPDGFAKFGTV